MRKKIVAGNWKMNTTLDEGILLLKEVLEKNKNSKAINSADLVIIAPPFTHLARFSELVKNAQDIFLAAQNCSSKKSGAYTGEIAASMVKSAGAEYVILGHSERREYFNEKDSELAQKINQALENDLKPIFCCGESLKERESGMFFQTVSQQIESALFHLSAEQFMQLIIAYEPVWAIGTGLSASAQQAQDMHTHIRKIIALKFGSIAAENLTILYGGSCNPTNAKELFANADVDGGLIGGASLKPEDFYTIINSY
ncbi:MAG: triose-phosphate isomerase [Bacteroidetes bacterium]|nr:triose-phosphate isomerase [Bacteroidota bacterium]HET6243673.1 triose-phosphate isomerase [Bacteroidia bacterium]